MTPKQKAYLLYTTYRFAMAGLNTDGGANNDSIAKQCALIAVNEILQAIGYCEDPESNYNVDCHWADVKQELEKL